MLESKAHRSFKMVGFSLVEPCHVPTFCFSPQSRPSSFLFWFSDACARPFHFSPLHQAFISLCAWWEDKKG